MFKEQKFSVVLVPAEPICARIKAKVEELAKEFDAPSFEPHLTLFSGYTNDPDKTKQSFVSIVGKLKRTDMVAKGVEHTEAFFKTLFVQFELNDDLTTMKQALHSLDKHSKYVLNPHMSLLYKRLPNDTKEELAQKAWGKIEAFLPQNKIISFTKIKMQTGSEKQDADTVREWKTLAEALLLT